MKTKRFAVLFLVVLLAAGMLVGCPPAAVQPQDPQGEQPEPKELGDITIGLSMYTLGAPYFMAQANAVEKKAAELGISLISIEAGDDMSKQLADVEDLLARGIDLLLLNPKDPMGLVPATKAATAAGVPVVIIDSTIDLTADFISIVQSNNLANGELVGEWLAKQKGTTPIKMALISGAKGNPVGKERRQGVFRGIIEQQLRDRNESGFQIVAQGWGNWAHEGGLDAMEDILVAFPDINVLLTENDSMALGAMRAIEAAGRKGQILIVAAADGQKEALELIKTGEYGVTGLNDPALVALTALDIGLRYLQGERNFPMIYHTPAVAITKENVDQFYNPDAVF